LFGRKICRKKFVKARGIEIGEAVARLFDGSRLGEIAGEAFAILGLIFARIRHVRADVNESQDRGVGTGFSDDGPAASLLLRSVRQPARHLLLGSQALEYLPRPLLSL
jgi:hypothetical protein